MSISKHSYPLPHLGAGDLFSGDRRNLFFGFCFFWVFIAFLELGQDYLSAMLNGNTFMIGESLSYKLFWLLFIPLSLALSYGFSKAENSFLKLRYLTVVGLLVLSATLIHLILFSFFLYGISNLVHEDPVTLLYILYEKLSTRLYIALSIYTVLVALHLLIKRRKSRQETTSKTDSKTITVKNGKSTLLVDTADIKWIGSDGAYLDIHTNDKKHVVIDSLKNIIKTLPGNFKRIHKSTIVNIDSIRKLKSRGNGDYDVIMDDDQELRLSRNFAKHLKGLIL